MIRVQLKRPIAVVLALILVLGFFPITVSATDGIVPFSVEDQDGNVYTEILKVSDDFTGMRGTKIPLFYVSVDMATTGIKIAADALYLTADMDEGNSAVDFSSDQESIVIGDLTGYYLSEPGRYFDLGVIDQTGTNNIYYLSVWTDGSGDAYGIILQLGSNAERPNLSAEFDTDPVRYSLDDPADDLRVTATAVSGDLSYQWYRNTVNSVLGAETIESAIGSSHTPDTSAGGCTYYYVVVTNFETGKNAVSVFSPIVPVIVEDPSAADISLSTLRLKYRKSQDGELFSYDYPVPMTDMYGDGRFLYAGTDYGSYPDSAWLLGSITPGATLKINDNPIDVDDLGHFECEVVGNTAGYHYTVVEITVISKDDTKTNAKHVFLFANNNRGNPQNWPTISSFVDTDGVKIGGYMSDNTHNRQGVMHGYKVANGVETAKITGKFKKATNFMEIFKLEPMTGQLNSCGEAVFDISETEFTSSMLNFDVGYNFFFMKQRTADSDDLVQYGSLCVYRQEPGMAPDTDFDPSTDLSVSDACGEEFDIAWNSEKSRYEGAIPSGGSDQNTLTFTLLHKPEGATVGNFNAEGKRAESIESGIQQIRTSYEKTYRFIVTAQDGINSNTVEVTIIRPGWTPLEGGDPDAAWMYQLGAESLVSANGTWYRSSMYPLNPDGTLGDAITFTSVPADKLSGGNAGFEYVVKPNDESAISKVARMSVSGTSKYLPSSVEVFVDGVEQVLPQPSDSFNLQGILHTGKSIYGPSNESCTKIEIKVMSDLSGYEGQRTYAFYLPYIKPLVAELANLKIANGRATDKGSELLYERGTNYVKKTTFSNDVVEYDAKVSYNCEYLYLNPTVMTSDVTIAYKLNGKTVEPTNPVSGAGNDGVIKLDQGSSTLVLECKFKGDTDGSSKKVYTLYVNRGSNCNAVMAYSDSMSVVGNTDIVTSNQISVSYPKDKTTFDLTVTAEVEGRDISVMQSGDEKASGTSEVTASGLSVLEEATVVVSDNATNNSRTYTIVPLMEASEGATSTYALMPAPGQFINTTWDGFDFMRVVGGVGAPTEENPGGSGGGSLGVFGGFVTYYFEDPILNHAKNKFGADFQIGGNAFSGNNEPASVMVAQDLDGDKKPDKDLETGEELWYELAGSMYYDDGTIHGYSITYENPSPSFMPYFCQDVLYEDNQGGSGTAVRANGFHPQPYYPDGLFYKFDKYPGNQGLYKDESITFTGSLLDAENLGGRGIPVRFGYADCAPVKADKIETIAGNPYRESRDTKTCFDIDWAVDSNGKPVRLEEISFVKIYSSTLYDKDATGELSPEIGALERLDRIGSAQVGKTPKPSNIRISAEGFDAIILDGNDLPDSGELYSVNVGERRFVQTIVSCDKKDAAFVNNDRVTPGAATAAYLEVTSDSRRLIRVIVQRDEMEPYIVVLELTGTAESVDTALTRLEVKRNGTDISELRKTGDLSYSLNVPANYSDLQIFPFTKKDAVVTVNGKSVNEDGYVPVTLGAPGTETAITIAVLNGTEIETTLLTVFRDKAEGATVSAGTVTLSVEKFTLGQGYIAEPIQVPIQKGDTAADVVTALLTSVYGSKGYISSTNNAYGSFYLSDVYDANRGELNVPEFIMQALAATGTALDPNDSTSDYLGEFDYTYTSGWMITVNNLFIPVSAGLWELNSGDVVRWQFTLYGLGADIGNTSPDSEFGGQDSIIPPTNRDMLTQKIAEINGDGNREALLAAGNNRERYDNALLVIQDLQSTQAELNAALAQLNSFDGIGTPATSRKSTEGTLTPKATVMGGVAQAAVSTSDMDKAIEDIKNSQGKAITIEPEITGGTSKTTVELPKSSLSAIVSHTMADLVIVTPEGSLTIPNDALESVAYLAAGSTVIVSLEAVDTGCLTLEQQKAVGNSAVYDISIASGGKTIGSFGGKSVTISLPYVLKAGETSQGVTVWYMGSSGNLEKVSCEYNKTTGEATFVTDHLSRYVVGYEAVWANPFKDVKSSDWYFDAVKYAVRNGLFKGTSGNTFEPDSWMTRAMSVTVLYRLEGEPEVSGSSDFADVGSAKWYTDAVMWANSQGIVEGYDNGLFGTDDPVTREQMAAILYRYANYKGHDTSVASALAMYADVSEIASYALDAMAWANAKGIITGRTASTLSPSGTATRAEVATILMRFLEGK